MGGHEFVPSGAHGAGLHTKALSYLPVREWLFRESEHDHYSVALAVSSPRVLEELISVPAGLLSCAHLVPHRYIVFLEFQSDHVAEVLDVVAVFAGQVFPQEASDVGDFELVILVAAGQVVVED